MQQSKSNLIALSFFSALLIIGIYGYVNIDTSRPGMAKLTHKEASLAAANEPQQSKETTILADSIANQDGETVSTTESSYWIGTATNKASSYLSIRFSSSEKIPANIKSASLEITPSANSSQPLNADLYAEKSKTVTVFSNQNPISKPDLTTLSVELKYSIQWKQNQKITIGGLENIVKESVELSKGNEINIIIVGTGNSNQKRPIYGISGISELAPKLTIVSQ
jgi:hypothetical protein